ncbi:MULTISPECIES: hypothetical protein [unclassified Streptomyces]|uniref:hypothetical protein n=1 Tax=unclassified Streptomyces TaxID=2593676 RepID=UPI002E2E0803|nr:hypothetical protein [Streptomyces sp. NBC_00223]
MAVSVAVLLLLGTLVTAPSAIERTSAAAQFAAILHVKPVTVETTLTDSWPVRHDGRLRSTAEVAAHQALYCGDGGGDELAGAQRAGMRAVRVARRGGPAGLALGEIAWSGTSIPEVEALPSLLSSWRDR